MNKGEAVLLLSFVAFYTLFVVGLLFVAYLSSSTLSPFPFILLAFLGFVPSMLFAYDITVRLKAPLLPRIKEDKVSERVAILYCTRDDFLPNYAETCLKNSQPHDFWVLDDSEEQKSRELINEFCTRLGAFISRRKNLRGYKGGNLNDWLQVHGDKYDYAFILDSDSKIGKPIITDSLSVMEADLKIAILQTNSETGKGKTFFERLSTKHERALGVMSGAFAACGLARFYGHNAMVRISALKDVGGFGEFIDEATKTMVRLYDKGWKIVFADNINTREETPKKYSSWRSRNRRWVWQTFGRLGLLRFRLPMPIRLWVFYSFLSYLLPPLSLLVIAHSIVSPFHTSNFFQILLFSISVYLTLVLAWFTTRRSRGLKSMLSILFLPGVFYLLMFFTIALHVMEWPIAKLRKEITFTVTPKEGINHVDD